MSDDRMTAALRRAAQHDPVRPLDPSAARRMVEIALAAAADSTAAPGADDPPVHLPMRRAWPYALAAAAAAALFVGIGAGVFDDTSAGPLVSEARSEKPASYETAPSRAVLPTGDRIVAAPGAEYDVVSLDADRRLRLDRGSLLCDVRTRPGSRFSVITPELEVEVLGTVFALDASEGRTAVWVYEGRVRVTPHAGERRELGAGDAFASDGSAAGTGALEREGREAAALRRPRPTAVEADPPDPRPPARRPPPRETPPLASSGVDLHAARVMVGRGEARAARDRADEVLRRSPDPDWLILRADAERALGNPARATDDLERAWQMAPERHAELGYRLAVVRLRAQSDPAGALAALERGEVTGAGSPLAERGLALAIEVHGGLGRHVARRAAIDAYLRRFPTTSLADRLRAER